jgi:hypothetical protein
MDKVHEFFLSSISTPFGGNILGSKISDSLSCCFQAGIGTDVTMHEHIKKLLDRCYATKDANSRFSPTNLVRFMPYGSSIILLHVSYYVVYMTVMAIIMLF